MKVRGEVGPADQSGAARLFDLRIMIGGLFAVYGITLFVAGLFATRAEIRKAAGVDIDLWSGIGMLVVGVLFLLWWRTQPLQLQPEQEPIAATRRRGAERR